MYKYAKIRNVEKGTIVVGEGNPLAVWKKVIDPSGNTKILYVKDYYTSLGMSLMLVLKGYNGAWYLKGKAPLEPFLTRLKKYLTAVQKHLDATAQSRGYDNTYTCLSYLNSTDQQWKRLSNAFNVWRDAVWRRTHLILNDWKAGLIEMPSIQEVIQMLPVIDWNDN